MAGGGRDGAASPGVPATCPGSCIVTGADDE